MNGRVACVVLMMVLGCLSGNSAHSQVVIQPSPLPTITADNEPWYLEGQPISHAGNIYFPAGAQVPFSRAEMVRSGFFMGVPLYSRTTIEPYSVVYVPLANGFMQPYHRPRTGELTGTAGSIPSPLPYPPATVPPHWLAAQAAGPPTQTVIEVPVQMPRPFVMPPEPQPEAPVATTGRAAAAEPMHVWIGDKPEGTQSIFIEYEGRRWYPEGPPQKLDRSALIRLPDFHGFEVWAKDRDAVEIFIPVTSVTDLAVAYTLTKPKTPFR